MAGKPGGLVRYLLGLPCREPASCPATLEECRLLRQGPEPVLWASLSFVNPGPEPTSFAASCFVQAFQRGLALRPALVRNQPAFRGQNGLQILPPGQGLTVYLAWRLHNPAASVEICLSALFPLPGQDWSACFHCSLSAGKNRRL